MVPLTCVPRVVKVVRESRMWFPRIQEKGKCRVSYKGYRISVEEETSSRDSRAVLETVGGDDGCTTI